MSQAEIQTSGSLELLSRAAAQIFLELSRERLKQGKTFAVALSGGKTPQTFLEMLASPEFAGQIPWESTHLFQVDERCVPPDDPESNYRMIHETLLLSIPNAAARFHRMRAEQPNLEETSQEYESELRKTLAPAGQAAPRFDLIFLGMGSDGHTASLFPGSAALAERNRWVCPNYVERLRMYRLTLTYPVLNAAANVAFLVAGSGKAEVLREVLEGPQNPERYPAQGVNPAKGRLIWYIDEPASHLLRRAARNVR